MMQPYNEKTKDELVAIIEHRDKQIVILRDRCDVLRGGLNKVAENNILLRKRDVEMDDAKR